ncbi:YbgC/FadM family acyl-CoA thioesterase [Lichenicoccus sp.]|uniref:YbgC/FadM family acyl-CoA thioesterase n=1 Tax=Lichenicoccus sp. TaxID=2781899 RepID=UPI003D12D012
MRHVFRQRVYYEDTDAGGVMYHAQYLAFAERARTEAMRWLGLPVSALLREHGIGFVVQRASVLYRRPVRLDDEVEVITTLRELTAARMRLDQAIRGTPETEPDLKAMLEIDLACIQMQTLRPSRIPPHWRDLLAQLADTEDASQK